MRLTKKKAIGITIELWEWLAKTGGQKTDWGGWGEYGKMAADCPLCEYNLRRGGYSPGGEYVCEEGCPFCPLQGKLWQRCYSLNFGKWCGAYDVPRRKKYATLFLEQLRGLK